MVTRFDHRDTEISCDNGNIETHNPPKARLFCERLAVKDRCQVTYKNRLNYQI